MKFYTVRVSRNHDFYVLFRPHMTVMDIKDEMCKQIGGHTSKMSLIFNGKLMKNYQLLANYGATTSSILYLFISGWENRMVQSPCRTLLDLISLVTNLENMEFTEYIEAMKQIRADIESPKMHAFAEANPKAKATLCKLIETVNETATPLDFYAIRLLCKAQDDAFHQLESLSDGLRLMSSELSDINTIVEVNNEYDEQTAVEQEPEEQNLTYLDYEPCISSDPIPFDYTYDFE